MAIALGPVIYSSLTLGSSQNLIPCLLPVQALALPARAGDGFSLYPKLMGAALFAGPQCTVNESPHLWLFSLEGSGPSIGAALPVSNSAYLLQTFISRFRRIMDSSQNAYNEDTSVLMARLDELERALFRAGQKGLNDFQSWEKGQASQITASSLVQNYGKRKFADIDG